MAAADRPGLISADYRALNAALHEARPNWGTTGAAYAETVANALRVVGAKTFLDYGSGKGMLAAEVRRRFPALSVREYDPAIPGKDQPPEPVDVVACVDVLEHVEIDCLDAVLDDLLRVTLRMGCFAVATGPAKAILPDGRNAHLIQQHLPWWSERLATRFTLVNHREGPKSFMAIVQPIRSATKP